MHPQFVLNSSFTSREFINETQHRDYSFPLPLSEKFRSIIIVSLLLYEIKSISLKGFLFNRYHISRLEYKISHSRVKTKKKSIQCEWIKLLFISWAKSESVWRVERTGATQIIDCHKQASLWWCFCLGFIWFITWTVSSSSSFFCEKFKQTYLEHFMKI